MCVEVFDFQLTADAGGDDSVTTEFEIKGRVVRVELYTADTVANNATIKGYEAGALTAVGARHDFLAYTKTPAAALSAEILPTIQRTDIAGVAVAAEYAPPIVGGKLTLAIAGFTPDTGIQIRVYVES